MELVVGLAIGLELGPLVSPNSDWDRVLVGQPKDTTIIYSEGEGKIVVDSLHSILFTSLQFMVGLGDLNIILVYP